MHLHKIKLVQYRVYESASFEFSPGINLIAGPNAIGKTSLLEAIYLLIGARSFRTHRHAEMIAFGTSGFMVEGAFEKEGIAQSLRLFSNGKEKGAIYNSTKFVNWAPIVGLMNGAVLTPDDAMLIKGPPQQRRQYLDALISQSDPVYIHYLERYARALNQRNALLRQMKTKTIETWEMDMAHSAACLITKRSKVIHSLNLLLKQIHYELSGEKEKISLHYKNGIYSPEEHSEDIIKQKCLQALQECRTRELEVGYTLTGPHKDDIDININGKDVRSFASEGQQRTSVGSLKLAEWHFLKEAVGELPLMLIDDLGVSLDDGRQMRFLKMLEGLGQVFLTSTEEVEGVSYHKLKINTPLGS